MEKKGACLSYLLKTILLHIVELKTKTLYIHITFLQEYGFAIPIVMYIILVLNK